MTYINSGHSSLYSNCLQTWYRLSLLKHVTIKYRRNQPINCKVFLQIARFRYTENCVSKRLKLFPIIRPVRRQSINRIQPGPFIMKTEGAWVRLWIICFHPLSYPSSLPPTALVFPVIPITHISIEDLYIFKTTASTSTEKWIEKALTCLQFGWCS